MSSSLSTILQRSEFNHYINTNLDPVSASNLIDYPDRARTAIQEHLKTKGFTFQTNYETIENRVYFIVHYKGEFFDAEVDTEVLVMSRLDQIYLDCYNHILSQHD